jgi:hypothetical protein
MGMGTAVTKRSCRCRAIGQHDGKSFEEVVERRSVFHNIGEVFREGNES